MIEGYTYTREVSHSPKRTAALTWGEGEGELLLEDRRREEELQRFLDLLFVRRRRPSGSWAARNADESVSVEEGEREIRKLVLGEVTRERGGGSRSKRRAHLVFFLSQLLGGNKRVGSSTSLEGRRGFVFWRRDRGGHRRRDWEWGVGGG